MRFSRTLLAGLLAFTSLQSFAQPAETIQVSDAKLVLRQQYAELEDLKTQLKLVIDGSKTNKIAFAISSSLIAAGLIIDILAPEKAVSSKLTYDNAVDALITLGAGSGLVISVVIAIDGYKAKQIEERIIAQQAKIEQTVKGML